MASMHDVAAAVLARTGRVPTAKLQQLVYYAKAWHAVWAGEELFPEGIEAWPAGPACAALYEVYKGNFAVSSWPPGRPGDLSQAEVETVDAVVSSYGQMDEHVLASLARSEAPWRDARRAVPPLERGHEEIDLGSMVRYYSAVEEDGSSVVV